MTCCHILIAPTCSRSTKIEFALRDGLSQNGSASHCRPNAGTRVTVLVATHYAAGWHGYARTSTLRSRASRLVGILQRDTRPRPLFGLSHIQRLNDIERVLSGRDSRDVPIAVHRHRIHDIYTLRKWVAQV